MGKQSGPAHINAKADNGNVRLEIEGAAKSLLSLATMVVLQIIHSMTTEAGERERLALMVGAEIYKRADEAISEDGDDDATD